MHAFLRDKRVIFAAKPSAGILSRISKPQVFQPNHNRNARVKKRKICVIFEALFGAQNIQRVYTFYLITLISLNYDI